MAGFMAAAIFTTSALSGSTTLRQVSITGTGRQLVGQVVVSFTARIETFTAGLPDADHQLLAQLAARIVAADADRRGIDLRTLPADQVPLP
jgi:hypothetical protein